ncbi:MAG: hypothetical protein AAF636_22165 [Pseudomonadota bacterium]
MKFRCNVAALLLIGSFPGSLLAQSEPDGLSDLYLELNSVQQTGGACRMTFMARNDTGETIDAAIFETVVFDMSGGVITLSLFDFRELPAGRPRVRQFDLPGVACASVGQTLINGASTCTVAGADSAVCQDALKLGSRLDVELLG